MTEGPSEQRPRAHASRVHRPWTLQRVGEGITWTASLATAAPVRPQDRRYTNSQLYAGLSAHATSMAAVGARTNSCAALHLGVGAWCSVGLLGIGAQGAELWGCGAPLKRAGCAVWMCRVFKASNGVQG